MLMKSVLEPTALDSLARAQLIGKQAALMESKASGLFNKYADITKQSDVASASIKNTLFGLRRGGVLGTGEESKLLKLFAAGDEGTAVLPVAEVLVRNCARRRAIFEFMF